MKTLTLPLLALASFAGSNAFASPLLIPISRGYDAYLHVGFDPQPEPPARVKVRSVAPGVAVHATRVDADDVVLGLATSDGEAGGWLAHAQDVRLSTRMGARCGAGVSLMARPHYRIPRACAGAPLVLDVELPLGRRIEVRLTASSVTARGVTQRPIGLVGFDPQPEPPADEVGFDPQPEPPADEVGFDPQPEPPADEVGFDPQPEPPAQVGLLIEFPASTGTRSVSIRVETRSLY
ncbi:MAG: hypothetical protein AAFZ18_18170 [Myxococcota bacterium]